LAREVAPPITSPGCFTGLHVSVSAFNISAFGLSLHRAAFQFSEFQRLIC
jgi:hypothetical protein